MVSAFDSCEADFFGELATDAHGVWEVFEFVRLHFPAADETQVLQKGLDYIMRWIRAGWIQISDSPLYPSTIATLPALSYFLWERGAAATHYMENSPSLDITEEALRVYHAAI